MGEKLIYTNHESKNFSLRNPIENYIEVLKSPLKHPYPNLFEAAKDYSKNKSIKNKNRFVLCWLEYQVDQTNKAFQKNKNIKTADRLLNEKLNASAALFSFIRNNNKNK
jgi:hypothetical protein